MPGKRTSPHRLLLAACAVVVLFGLSCSRSTSGTSGESAAPAAGGPAVGAAAAGSADGEESDDPTVADDVPRLVPDAPEVMPAVDTSDPRLFMVGDSVLLASATTTEEMLPSWTVTADAEVGRGVPTGRSVVAARLREIGDVAVVVLGHNYDKGGGFEDELDQIMRDLGDLERVVWVTVAEWSPAQIEVNRAIRAAPRRYDNVVVADWEALTVENPGYLQADDVHTSTAGTLALADLMARAVGPGPLDVHPKMVEVDVPLAPDLPADYYTTTSTTGPYSAPVPTSWVPPVPTTTYRVVPTTEAPTTTIASTSLPPTSVGPTLPTTTVASSP